MTEKKPTPYVDAIFNSHSLTGEEMIDINNVVNWRANDFPNVIDLAGRSVTTLSPSFANSSDTVLKGLQTIGAGGDMSIIKRQGNQPFIEPKPTLLTRVSQVNRAKSLSHITEQHTISKDGNIVSWNKLYVPSQGMDKDEARNRSYYTDLVEQLILDYKEQGIELGIVVPKIAAEGIFTSKIDAYGENLAFQTYRVPLEYRFPQQFIDAIVKQGPEVANEKLGAISFLLGHSLRFLHEHDLAYMQSHLGNMSLIEKDNKYSIYLTDLGTVQEISSHPFKNRFRGLDVFISLNILKNMRGYKDLAKKKYPSLDDEKFELKLWGSVIYGFIEGYFALEKAQYTHDEKTYKVELNNMAQEFTEGFLAYTDPQEFVEFFEKFYQKSLINNRILNY